MGGWGITLRRGMTIRILITRIGGRMATTTIITKIDNNEMMMVREGLQRRRMVEEEDQQPINVVELMSHPRFNTINQLHLATLNPIRHLIPWNQVIRPRFGGGRLSIGIMKEEEEEEEEEEGVVMLLLLFPLPL
jgi:hypothetical protein